MNGRVYDPEIGVFLSADPLVQFPYSTQGLNRYAYVGNNPLSYTDPSGHLIFGLIAAAIMVKVESWVVATVIAAVAGYLDTGSLKSAFFSGLSAGLGFGVGDFVKLVGFESAFAVGFATATTHGLIQGSISAAQGGRFGSAAMAGFAGSALGGRAGSPPSWGGAIRAAIVGGTVSRIGGGKFLNGAGTATFTYAIGFIDSKRASTSDVVIGPDPHEISSEDAKRYFDQVIETAEALGVDVSTVTFGDGYGVKLRNGDRRVIPDYEEYRRLIGSGEAQPVDAWRRGSFRRGFGPWATSLPEEIVLTKSAFAVDVLTVVTTSGVVPVNIPAGFQSGLFVLGHEIGHRYSDSEQYANRHGLNFYNRACEVRGGC